MFVGTFAYIIRPPLFLDILPPSAYGAQRILDWRVRNASHMVEKQKSPRPCKDEGSLRETTRIGKQDIQTYASLLTERNRSKLLFAAWHFPSWSLPYRDFTRQLRRDIRRFRRPGFHRRRFSVLPSQNGYCLLPRLILSFAIYIIHDGSGFVNIRRIFFRGFAAGRI